MNTAIHELRSTLDGMLAEIPYTVPALTLLSALSQPNDVDIGLQQRFGIPLPESMGRKWARITRSSGHTITVRAVHGGHMKNWPDTLAVWFDHGVRNDGDGVINAKHITDWER